MRTLARSGYIGPWPKGTAGSSSSILASGWFQCQSSSGSASYSIAAHGPTCGSPHPEGRIWCPAVILDQVQFNPQWQAWKLTFARNCYDLAPALLLETKNAELFQKWMVHRMQRLQNSRWSVLWFHVSSPENMWPNKLGSFRRFGLLLNLTLNLLIFPSDMQNDLILCKQTSQQRVLGLGGGWKGKKESNISLMLSVVV